MTVDVLFHRSDTNIQGVSTPYDNPGAAAQALYGKDANGAMCAMVTLHGDAALMQFFEAMARLGQDRLQAAMRSMLMPTAQVALWSDKVTTRAGEYWKVLCKIDQATLQMQGQALPPPLVRQ